MSECWEGEPCRRPLLGEVQQRLSHIYERYKSGPSQKTAKDGPSYKSGKALKYRIKWLDECNVDIYTEQKKECYIDSSSDFSLTPFSDVVSYIFHLSDIRP